MGLLRVTYRSAKGAKCNGQSVPRGPTKVCDNGSLPGNYYNNAL